MGCFKIARAKCTNLIKQEKLEPKRWSEKCCHSSLEISMTFRGKCGGKKACVTDKLQSIACSRLSSGGLMLRDFWPFPDSKHDLKQQNALTFYLYKQASELRKQQIITGSFLWSTGSFRVQLLQMALKHAKETNSNTA
ncbi:hypothetical protein T12_11341 [Trichinella patagoniensis]|uniref:Uncharacterized protein n=1 Tax=Trichinella patagoniensis TaxID=990121 RepID=A0A0V1A9M8_9BILA|nr:hypothetical protein T12_11341 [Trichinella patagoniensis]